MPQLAYSGAPTVGPSNVTQDSQQIRVSPEAFGAGVGEALQKFGGTLEHTSDNIYAEVQKSQAILNDTISRDATTATQVAGGDLKAKFDATEGLNTVAARPAFVKAITDLVKKTAEGITNPEAKKNYLDQMSRQTGAWLNSSATYAAGQQKVAANNSADAAIAMAQNNAGVFATDDKAMDAQLAQIHKSVADKAALAGWDETSTKRVEQEAVSKAWLFRFSSLAQSDPAAAKALYDKMKAGGGAPATPNMAVEKPTGLVAPGNIDLNTRPTVKNSDGTISTVKTISYEQDGKEVLIPTVSDEGKILSNKEAIQYWKDKGQNLGVFDTPENATAYAKQLHEQQDKSHSGGSGAGVMTLSDDLAVQKTIQAGITAKTSRSIANEVTDSAGPDPSGVGSAMYYKRVGGGESGGKNIPATDRDSSAYGTYQITKGTWETEIKRHPELGYTMADRYDAAKQEVIMRKLTGDNAKQLTDAHIEITDRNLYMAHFMGAGAGTSFLRQMQKYPGMDAVEAFPREAAANRGVFYNKDGSHRTLAQVYAKQTDKFGGKPTLAELQSEGQARANAIDPNNDQLKDAVETHIQTNYNQNKAAEAEAYNNNQQSLISAITGDGDYSHGKHSLADIQQDPALNTAYNALKPDDQKTMRGLIDAQNSEHDKRPATLAETERVSQLNGQLIVNPKQLAETPLSDFLNLPEKERNQAIALRDRAIEATAKKQVSTASQADRDASNAMIGRLSNLLGPNGKPALLTMFGDEEGKKVNTANPHYQQFVGSLQDAVDEFRQNNDGKMPTEEVMRQMAGDLLLRTSRTTVPGKPWGPYGVFGTYGQTTEEHYAYENFVPGTMVPIIRQRLRDERISDPTDAQIADRWQQMKAARAQKGVKMTRGGDSPSVPATTPDYGARR